MIQKITLSLLYLWISVQSLVELFAIVFQPNDYRSVASTKWILVFILIATYTLLFLAANLLAWWRGEFWQKTVKSIQEKLSLAVLRERLGVARYFLAFLITLFVIYVFQYSLWGLIFAGIYFRLFVWLNLVYFLAFLLSHDQDWANWSGLFSAVVFTSVSFGLASVFSNILSYPFGLYWSDGNRLWDYSLIFGRDRYNYPADQDIYSLTSYGRQILWGLPFLLPNNTIWISRLWSAVLYSLPSIILGFIAFSTWDGKKRDALLLGLWAFLFLNQGPIYTPLILSAILVALAWERPLWLALPLIATAGYYAELSRFTWFIAPAVWAGMLYLNRTKLKGVRPTLGDWGIGVLYGVSGLLVWRVISIVNNVPTVEQAEVVDDGVLSSFLYVLSEEPLIWSRLLPNPTYPEGILGGLVIAIFPLTILLFCLYRRDGWKPLPAQLVTIWLPAIGFGLMGIVASTKIGGGNNLHNLDMFLITLVFVAAMAWRNGGQIYFENLDTQPAFIINVVLLAFLLPALPALRSLEPLLSLSKAEIRHIQLFTGKDMIETLPPANKVADALWTVDNVIKEYAPLGEVLFIDQRQLLTFGNVPQVPLVQEYEKKVLMNAAMARDAEYFQDYYRDISKQRFSLIISEPLKLSKQEGQGSFAIEGDLWSQWVSEPTLCFYEPLFTLRDVYVQLLVPREDVQGCEVYLE